MSNRQWLPFVGVAHRLLVVGGWFALVTASAALDPIDEPPISYHSAPSRDAVAKLQAALDADKATLAWDGRWGWLPAVLERLNVPRSSQTLVFSKTSLQAAKISPRTPRALYFNDDVYVGWVPGGELVEVSAVDPMLGPVFYTLRQRPVERPRFERDQGTCLACHNNARTRDVPGLLVRSVFPDTRGHAILSLGDETTDPTTPLAERYGGWYVSGSAGGATHRGNQTFADPLATEPDEPRKLALSETCNEDLYLTPHSDVVALMVLEHQSQAHNAITRAMYEARRATAYDTMWGEILGKPPGHVFDVSTRRLDRAADDLAGALLFRDEQALSRPIEGDSPFAEEFAVRGRRGASGRSLREFDLRTRLFRLACSYLIESESYAALPEEIRSRVAQRIEGVLKIDEPSSGYANLTDDDRAALRGLLAD